MRCSTWSLDWIARVLVSIECSFVVRRPDELRKALGRCAEKIATLAKRTSYPKQHSLLSTAVG